MVNSGEINKIAKALWEILRRQRLNVPHNEKGKLKVESFRVHYSEN